MNRYPDLFNICQQQLHTIPHAKILSFGCSTGEEVFSLFNYLPNADFLGVDLSHACIRQASAKNKHVNIQFLHSLSDNYLAAKDFDAIFALAVLQHVVNRHPSTTHAHQFTFYKFNQALLKLDKKLKVGGLLFIDRTDFNFLDTEIAARYTPLQHPLNQIERPRPRFDKNNNKISDLSFGYRVFIKMSEEVKSVTK